MNVGDLIAELQKFPELASVFYQQGEDIVRLDSTHEIWVETASTTTTSGPFTEVPETGPTGRGSVDHGVLLYG